MKATLCFSFLLFLGTINLQGQTFTWTNVNGDNFTTTGKDQRIQGPCYVHAAAALVEAMYEIENNAPLFEMDLSEPYLYSSCILEVAESGEQIKKALTHIRDFGVLCQEDHPDYLPSCPSSPDSTYADCLTCFFNCVTDCTFFPAYCAETEVDCIPACHTDECMMIENNCYSTQGYTMEITDECISYLPSASKTRVRIAKFEHIKGEIASNALISLIESAPIAIHFKDPTIHTLDGKPYDHAYLVVGYKITNSMTGADTLWHVKDSWPQLNNRFRFLDFDLQNVIATKGAYTAEGVFCEEKNSNGQWEIVPCGCGNGSGVVVDPPVCTPDQNPNVSVTFGGQTLFNPISNIDLCNAQDGNIITISLTNELDYLNDCIEEIEWDAIGIGGSSVSGVSLLALGNNQLCDVEFLLDGSYGISVRFKYTNGTWSPKRWVYVDFEWNCFGGGGGMNLSILPNPGDEANDIKFRVKSLKENELKVLSIFNLNGKLVHQEKIYATEEQLILNNLKEGLYFIHLINEEGEEVYQKLIIR